MNIFVLDTNPVLAARFHNDRHVVKMILESAQIMSTAHVMLDGMATARSRVPLILRPTHENHPCVIWTRSSGHNYRWLSSLMWSLLSEYTTRYGKLHSYERVCSELGLQPLNMPMIERTPFVQCMPTQYQCSDPVQAYREYYFGDKQHLASWRVVGVPVWWQHKMTAREVVRG